MICLRLKLKIQKHRIDYTEKINIIDYQDKKRGFPVSLVKEEFDKSLANCRMSF